MRLLVNKKLHTKTIRYHLSILIWQRYLIITHPRSIYWTPTMFQRLVHVLEHKKGQKFILNSCFSRVLVHYKRWSNHIRPCETSIIICQCWEHPSVMVRKNFSILFKIKLHLPKNQIKNPSLSPFLHWASNFSHKLLK